MSNEPITPLRGRLGGTALVIVLAGAALTAGCAGSSRWCEHDATDTRVSDSYCEQGLSGYEWETSSGGHRPAVKVTSKTTSSTSGRSESGSSSTRTGSRSSSRTAGRR